MTAEEIADLTKEVEKHDQWLNKTSGLQTQLAQFQDPVLTVASLTTAQSELVKVCDPIMNKKKPDPKPEPPADTATDASSEAPQEQASDAAQTDTATEAGNDGASEESMDVSPDGKA